MENANINAINNQIEEQNKDKNENNNMYIQSLPTNLFISEEERDDILSFIKAVDTKEKVEKFNKIIKDITENDNENNIKNKMQQLTKLIREQISQKQQIPQESEKNEIKNNTQNDIQENKNEQEKNEKIFDDGQHKFINSSMIINTEKLSLDNNKGPINLTTKIEDSNIELDTNEGPEIEIEYNNDLYKPDEVYVERNTKNNTNNKENNNNNNDDDKNNNNNDKNNNKDKSLLQHDDDSLQLLIAVPLKKLNKNTGKLEEIYTNFCFSNEDDRKKYMDLMNSIETAYKVVDGIKPEEKKKKLDEINKQMETAIEKFNNLTDDLKNSKTDTKGFSITRTNKDGHSVPYTSQDQSAVDINITDPEFTTIRLQLPDGKYLAIPVKNNQLDTDRTPVILDKGESNEAKEHTMEETKYKDSSEAYKKLGEYLSKTNIKIGGQEVSEAMLNKINEARGIQAQEKDKNVLRFTAPLENTSTPINPTSITPTKDGLGKGNSKGNSVFR